MNLYAAVLAVITLALLTVSLARLNKTKTKADYLVAGRSLPAFVLVFTLLSSPGSAPAPCSAAPRTPTTTASPRSGRPPADGPASLLIYFIAPRARKFAQFTIPDLLEARYNQTARVLGVIAILFTYTAITSYQFIGGGDILHLIFPDAITAIYGRYIIAAFVIVFTAIAGMSSVAYMDVVIGLLATVTMLLALPVLIHHAGGWSAVHAALPATHFQVLGDLTLIQGFELFLPTCLLMLGNQSMYQKFFSAKSRKGRHPRRRRLDHRHRHPRDHHRRPRRHRLRPLPHRRSPPRIPAKSSPTPPHGFNAAPSPSAARHHRSPPHCLSSSAPARRRHLRQGRLHRQQLSLLARHQPRQRRLRPLHRPRRRQQAHPHRLPPHGRPARPLGALSILAHRIRAQESPLRLHHLLRRAHARHPRRLLLEARHRQPPPSPASPPEPSSPSSGTQPSSTSTCPPFSPSGTRSSRHSSPRSAASSWSACSPLPPRRSNSPRLLNKTMRCG